MNFEQALIPQPSHNRANFLPVNSALWKVVQRALKSSFSNEIFQLWFEPLVFLEGSEDSMTLGVSNEFATIWIADNYLDLITDLADLTAGRKISIFLRRVDSSSVSCCPIQSAWAKEETNSLVEKIQTLRPDPIRHYSTNSRRSCDVFVSCRQSDIDVDKLKRAIHRITLRDEQPGTEATGSEANNLTIIKDRGIRLQPRGLEPYFIAYLNSDAVEAANRPDASAYNLVPCPSRFIKNENKLSLKIREDSSGILVISHHADPYKYLDFICPAKLNIDPGDRPHVNSVNTLLSESPYMKLLFPVSHDDLKRGGLRELIERNILPSSQNALISAIRGWPVNHIIREMNSLSMGLIARHKSSSTARSRTRQLYADNRLKNPTASGKDIMTPRRCDERSRFSPNFPARQPFNVGMPLHETDADMFAGRAQEVTDLLKALSWTDSDREKAATRFNTRPPIVILGSRGSGKSTFLHHLHRLIGDPYTPVLFDGNILSLARSTRALVNILATDIRDALQRKGADVADLSPRGLKGDPIRHFQEWLHRIEATSPRMSTILLCVDEYEALGEIFDNETGKSLLDCFQSLLRPHRRFAVVFAGKYSFDEMEPQWVQRLGAPRCIRLGRLSLRDVTELINRCFRSCPEIDSWRIGEIIHSMAAGHPFVVQTLGYMLVRLLIRERRLTATPDDLLAVRDDAVHCGEYFYKSIWEELNADEQNVLKLLAKNIAPYPDKTCARLRRRGVVDTSGHISMPLFNHWIATRHELLPGSEIMQNSRQVYPSQWPETDRQLNESELFSKRTRADQLKEVTQDYAEMVQRHSTVAYSRAAEASSKMHNLQARLAASRAQHCTISTDLNAPHIEKSQELKEKRENDLTRGRPTCANFNELMEEHLDKVVHEVITELKSGPDMVISPIINSHDDKSEDQAERHYRCLRNLQDSLVKMVESAAMQRGHFMAVLRADLQSTLQLMLSEVAQMFQDLIPNKSIKVYASIRRRVGTNYQMVARDGNVNGGERNAKSELLPQNCPTIQALSRTLKRGECVMIIDQNHPSWTTMGNDTNHDDLSVLLGATFSKKWHSIDPKFKPTRLEWIIEVATDRKGVFQKQHIPLMKCVNDAFGVILNLLIWKVPPKNEKRRVQSVC